MIEYTFNNGMGFWYDHPAQHWFDGLPLGNGRMGAMIFGGVRVEQIALSETTFWSGAASTENNNPDGPQILEKVRQRFQAGDVRGANQLCEELVGRKGNYGTNLPFGRLRLLFDHMQGEGNQYSRALDLDTALVTVRYKAGDVLFQREMCLSYPHQVLAIRLTCNEAGRLNLRLQMDGDEQPFRVRTEGSDTLVMDNHAYEMQHSNGQVGVDGHARLKVSVEGGKVSALDGQLIIQNADAVTIFLAYGTTFAGNDPAQQCQKQIEAASVAGYEKVRMAHISEHQGWFRSASLDLGPAPEPQPPLDQRLEAVRKGAEDPNLCALLFQFGRYLLIGSSRPDSPLPANLTGAWNDNTACRIGWTCDYHLDINTQMNYWITELTNLSECHRPLFNWIEKILVPSGRNTAQTLYDAPGWVAHIFSNAWGFTAWGWSTWWGVFPTGGVWAAMHLWDHYHFTGDRDFLAHQAYPVLKDAAEFFLAYMGEDSKTGKLLTGPANSPENAFLHEGQAYPVSMGPTVDWVLLRELFGACIEAIGLLDIDGELRQRLIDTLQRLPDYQIGKYGQIQEWLEDYEEAIPGHRHTSHLLGLFPFSQITPESTPQLAQAARVSIERRLSAPDYEEGAWARNNMTLFYARLQDRDAAYSSLMTLFHKEAGDSLFTGTRLAPANAYELDYNTGATAGIAEMLLQSHAGVIRLLPALPRTWPFGKASGLCARGGFVVDLEWENGRLKSAAILSKLGGICRVRSSAGLLVKQDGREISGQYEQNEYVFSTEPGGVYIIRHTEAYQTGW
jgi:alpha-L-fucosidase 2